jgi:predicted ATP-grasp superfamily ATP-dependent carboligase
MKEIMDTLNRDKEVIVNDNKRMARELTDIKVLLMSNLQNGSNWLISLDDGDEVHAICINHQINMSVWQSNEDKDRYLSNITWSFRFINEHPCQTDHNDIAS